MIYRFLMLMLVGFCYSVASYGALNPADQQSINETDPISFDHLIFDTEGYLVRTEEGEVLYNEENLSSDSEEYLVAGCYYHSYEYYYVCVKRNWWGTCTQSVLVYGPTRYSCY